MATSAEKDALCPSVSRTVAELPLFAVITPVNEVGTSYLIVSPCILKLLAVIQKFAGSLNSLSGKAVAHVLGTPVLQMIAPASPHSVTPDLLIATVLLIQYVPGGKYRHAPCAIIFARLVELADALDESFRTSGLLPVVTSLYPLGGSAAKITMDINAAKVAKAIRREFILLSPIRNFADS